MGGMGIESKGLRFPIFWLSLTVLFVYHANLSWVPGYDDRPNALVAKNLVTRGTLYFTPEEDPALFDWILATPRGARRVKFGKWDDVLIDGQTASELKKAQKLVLKKEMYFLVPTVKPGVYASTFGIGTAIAAVPFFAPAFWLFGDRMGPDTASFWYFAKTVASLYVLASVILIYLCARSFASVNLSFVIALIYAFGTAIWSISSQALWQHGPSEFLIALSAYLLLRQKFRHLLIAGMALGLASLCRPVNLAVVLTLFAYLLMTEKRKAWPFLLGATPPVSFLGAYNWFTYGAPWKFGQTLVGQFTALTKTGSPDVWQTPFLQGLAGILFSPSRGILIFSPFLALAILGSVMCWRNPTYRPLRPLLFAVLAIFAPACKWFDWWGGFSYGYRLVVDSCPLLILLCIPALPLVRIPVFRFLIGLSLVWSIYVQALGAFAYDFVGWNMREGHNIDDAEFRYRLWSWTDTPIFFYSNHFLAAQQTKEMMTKSQTSQFE
jgi:hypothetical protein